MLIYGKLPLNNITISNKLKFLIAGATSGSLFYVIGYPLLPLTLSNYLMPVDLEQTGFVTIVDIIPSFINSYTFGIANNHFYGSYYRDFVCHDL